METRKYQIQASAKAENYFSCPVDEMINHVDSIIETLKINATIKLFDEVDPAEFAFCEISSRIVLPTLTANAKTKEFCAFVEITVEPVEAYDISEEIADWHLAQKFGGF